MLPAEAESQFTKIIRTRIVGDARRTIQDQIFDCVAQLTCNGADFLRLLPGLPPAGQLGRCQGSERGRREIASLGYVLMLKCIVRFISLLFVLQGGIRCLTKRWRMSYVRRRSRFHVDRRSVIAWRWFLAVRRDLRITVRWNVRGGAVSLISRSGRLFTGVIYTTRARDTSEPWQRLFDPRACAAVGGGARRSAGGRRDNASTGRSGCGVSRQRL